MARALSPMSEKKGRTQAAPQVQLLIVYMGPAAHTPLLFVTITALNPHSINDLYRLFGDCHDANAPRSFKAPSSSHRIICAR